MAVWPFKNSRRRPKPPLENWTSYGQLHHQRDGMAGFETPIGMVDRARALGQPSGDVRADAEMAVGSGAAANRHLTANAEVRKANWSRLEAEESVGARVRIATAQERTEQAHKRVPHSRARLERLEARKHPAALSRLETRAHVLADRQAEYEAMPPARRGYLNSRKLLAGIEVAVPAVDAAVTFGAMKKAGYGPTVAWMTTAVVPAGVWAINRMVGTASAAILEALGSVKVKLALGLTAVATVFMTLAAAFLLLAVFRHNGTAAANADFAVLANGEKLASFHGLIDAAWLGPLQIAASAAAALAVCAYTLGQRGRDKRRDIAKAEGERAAAEAEVEAVEAEIDAEHRALEEADVAINATTADGLAAMEELSALRDSWKAERDGEDALADSVVALQEHTFETRDRLMANGAVRLCAILDEEPRVLRRWRPMLRRPAARRRDPEPSQLRISNGHQPADKSLEQLFNPKS